DRVVPILQEKGVHRDDYTGTTLRDHLGLSAAPRPAGWGGPGQPLGDRHDTKETSA
ncbi:F420-dependent methylene-tetrahydromethanopterin reductase, partial [Streptomyces sp. MBT57]|nr:F420-dependent methylene-tetrahydromethanopterin reductase [Streptomyces sp. MBT57]